jgi:hypothetical protein
LLVPSINVADVAYFFCHHCDDDDDDDDDMPDENCTY